MVYTPWHLRGHDGLRDLLHDQNHSHGRNFTPSDPAVVVFAEPSLCSELVVDRGWDSRLAGGGGAKKAPIAIIEKLS